MKGKANILIIILYYLCGIPLAFATGYLFMKTASFAGGVLGKLIVYSILGAIIGFVCAFPLGKMKDYIIEHIPSMEYSWINLLHYVVIIVSFALILPKLFDVHIFFACYCAIEICAIIGGILSGGGEKPDSYSVKTTHWGNNYSQTTIRDSKGKETKINHWHV